VTGLDWLLHFPAHSQNGGDMSLIGHLLLEAMLIVSTLTKFAALGSAGRRGSLILSLLLLFPLLSKASVCTEAVLNGSQIKTWSAAILEQKIYDEGLRSLEDVLSIYPEKYLRNFTNVFKSRSSQEASPQQPRTIMFDLIDRFFSTFNNDPAHRGYNIHEVFEFEEMTETFVPNRFYFGKSRRTEKGLRAINANVFVQNRPQTCYTCHGVNFHPIWRRYPDWNDAYGGHDDTFLSFRAQESKQEDYKQFRAEGQNQGLYKFLRFPEGGWASPYRPPGYTDLHGYEYRPNLRLGKALSRLNAKAIAARLFKNVQLSDLHLLNFLMQDCSHANINSATIRDMREEVLTRYISAGGNPNIHLRYRDGSFSEELSTTTAQFLYTLGVLPSDWNMDVNDQKLTRVQEYRWGDGNGQFSDLLKYELLSRMTQREARLEPYVRALPNPEPAPWGDLFDTLGVRIDTVKLKAGCSVLAELALQKFARGP
jgi:hypothetical protein